MTELLDWQSVEAPLALVRLLARALRQGNVLVLPSETGYLAAASALAGKAVDRVGPLAGQEPAFLGVSGVAAARDWAPGLGEVGQRLARRTWPGPLTLACPCDRGGLLQRLPERACQLLCPQGLLHLRSPGHEAIQEVLREAAHPLLLAPLSTEGVRALLARDDSEVALVVEDGTAYHRQPATVVRVEGESWSVVRPGVLTEEQLRAQVARLVVFVCTGNTCRSPLAEALCKKRLAEALGCSVAELPARGFVIVSAGLSAAVGGPAAEEAVAVARDRGADLAGHRSRPLSADLAARADYLITMTGGHLRALLAHYPNLSARPRLLCPAGDDLADPIGQPRDVYERCAGQIEGYLESLVADLINSPSSPSKP